MATSLQPILTASQCCWFDSRSTALGHVAVATLGNRLWGLVFGHRTYASALHSLQKRLSRLPVRASDGGDHDGDPQLLATTLLERLERFAEGEAQDFGDIDVSTDHLTPLGRRVIKGCRAIRWGQRRTYGELAATAGAPGAARAVGQMMAGNLAPLVVPCHRVVGAGGRLGGFSAPQGLAMKRRLLELEAGLTGTTSQAVLFA